MNCYTTAQLTCLTCGRPTNHTTDGNCQECHCNILGCTGVILLDDPMTVPNPVSRDDMRRWLEKYLPIGVVSMSIELNPRAYGDLLIRSCPSCGTGLSTTGWCSKCNAEPKITP